MFFFISILVLLYITFFYDPIYVAMNCDYFWVIVDVNFNAREGKFRDEIDNPFIIIILWDAIFCFCFMENCLQMNNFVGGITGPPLLFAANNNLPNSVITSYVTRHKKFFLKKLIHNDFLKKNFLAYNYKIFLKISIKKRQNILF